MIPLPPLERGIGHHVTKTEPVKAEKDTAILGYRCKSQFFQDGLQTKGPQ